MSDNGDGSSDSAGHDSGASSDSVGHDAGGNGGNAGGVEAGGMGFGGEGGTGPSGPSLAEMLASLRNSLLPPPAPPPPPPAVSPPPPPPPPAVSSTPPKSFVDIFNQMFGLIGGGSTISRPSGALLPGYTPSGRSQFVPLRQRLADGFGRVGDDIAYVTGLGSLRGQRVAQGAVNAPARTPTPNRGVPRGIRNNNPGNIRKSRDNWRGSVSGDDPSFVTFDTPENGLRALARNIINQYRNGRYRNIDRIRQSMGLRPIPNFSPNSPRAWAYSYAPPEDGNNTEAYARSIADALGVGVNDAVDFSDPGVLARIMPVIVRTENGQNPYEQSQISEGIRRAFA